MTFGKENLCGHQIDFMSNTINTRSNDTQFIKKNVTTCSTHLSPSLFPISLCLCLALLSQSLQIAPNTSNQCKTITKIHNVRQQINASKSEPAQLNSVGGKSFPFRCWKHCKRTTSDWVSAACLLGNFWGRTRILLPAKDGRKVPCSM